MKPLEEKDKSLLTEAVSYASVNDYQIAIIYLEELLDKLQYSDDQDIEIDQQSNQSTIFTTELEYKF